MGRDITLPIEDGFVNMRVGAIIGREGKLLMVGNERMDYLYSVGGHSAKPPSRQFAGRSGKRQAWSWRSTAWASSRKTTIIVTPKAKKDG